MVSGSGLHDERAHAGVGGSVEIDRGEPRSDGKGEIEAGRSGRDRGVERRRRDGQLTLILGDDVEADDEGDVGLAVASGRAFGDERVAVGRRRCGSGGAHRREPVDAEVEADAPDDTREAVDPTETLR